ncbi:MAG: helix-turn-helix domain-containing protein [Candidatus Fimenecus sp.]
MNIKLADRLVALRKEKGYSQEVLAEKLGLSRQSISKWERAEASPDTDNLIALAEIYHMTLDELLGNSESTPKEEKKEKVKKPLLPVQKAGKKMFAALPLVALGIVVIFVIGGFIFGNFWWAHLWLLFFIIPIFATVATACRAGATKRLLYMLMTIPVGISAVVIFLMAGLFFDLWASAWIVFLAIPVYAYTAFLLTKAKSKTE